MCKLTPHTETPKAHGQGLTVLVLMAQWQMQGEGPGVRTSPLPYQTYGFCRFLSDTKILATKGSHVTNQ